MKHLLQDSGPGKSLSLITTAISYIAGLAIFISSFIMNRTIPTREESISLVIFLLGLNSVTASIDLSMIIRTWRGIKTNKKQYNNKNKE